MVYLLCYISDLDHFGRRRYTSRHCTDIYPLRYNSLSSSHNPMDGNSLLRVPWTRLEFFSKRRSPFAESSLGLPLYFCSASIPPVTGQSTRNQFRYQGRKYQDWGKKEGKIYLVGDVVDKPKQANLAIFAPEAGFDIKPTNSSILPILSPSSVLRVTPPSLYFIRIYR